MRMALNDTKEILSRDRIPYPVFCLQAESGRTEIPKICTRNYECRHCAFDQWLDEMEERDISRENRRFFIKELAKAA
jgi:hypothetical protein